jgi:DNA-binding beta-propeller fold protein YncE
MDENALRGMLERATREEPPMGQISVRALREGIKLRRRRRAQGAAVAVAAAAIVAAGVVPAVASHDHGVTAGPAVRGRSWAYAADYPGQVVPLSPTSAGRAIRVPGMAWSGTGYTLMALTPNGKTIWVTGSNGLLTPISTASGKPGAPINLHTSGLEAVTIAPDGRSAYVTTSAGFLPVDLAGTGHVGQLIRARYATQVVIAPNGKFAYAITTTEIIPISISTGAVSPPIPVSYPGGLIFSPDGRTAYALSEHDSQGSNATFIPISTLTNRVGTPVPIGGPVYGAAGVPGSWLAYVEYDSGKVAPVNLRTGRIGRAVQVNGFPSPMAVVPGGTSLYLYTYYQATKSTFGLKLTKFSITSDSVVSKLPIAGAWPGLIAVSPDGTTGYVTTTAGTGRHETYRLVEINLASDTQIQSFRVAQKPLQVLFTH